MSFERGFLFARAEADIEHYLASAGQKTTQNQRTGQAGVDPSKPSSPPVHGTSCRQFDPRHRIPPTFPTQEGNGRDHIRNRHPSHPLCSLREPQSAQKERDVNQVEAGGFVWQCFQLLSHMVA
jgi:hypothetical protein